MRLRIDEVVHLHQVDALDPKFCERLLHRVDAVLLAGRPNFRGKKKRLVQIEFRRDLADHLFGAPIHWRGIHNPAAEFCEEGEHFFEWLAFRGSRADIKGLPRPKPDDGKRFAG